MLIEEVMTKNILKIDSNKTVYEACLEYSNNKVGSLVVTNNDIIVGIVTERDTIERVILNDKNPKETKIRDIMTPNIKTVHALAPLERAAKIMRENNIKKLPVVLNNEIVGVVTETDLSRTIDVFSDAIEQLTVLYNNSRESLLKMMDDWEDILVELKNTKKITEKSKNNSFSEDDSNIEEAVNY